MQVDAAEQHDIDRRRRASARPPARSGGARQRLPAPDLGLAAAPRAAAPAADRNLRRVEREPRFGIDVERPVSRRGRGRPARRARPGGPRAARAASRPASRAARPDRRRAGEQRQVRRGVSFSEKSRERPDRFGAVLDRQFDRRGQVEREREVVAAIAAALAAIEAEVLALGAFRHYRGDGGRLGRGARGLEQLLLDRGAQVVGLRPERIAGADRVERGQRVAQSAARRTSPSRARATRRRPTAPAAAPARPRSPCRRPPAAGLHGQHAGAPRASSRARRRRGRSPARAAGSPRGCRGASLEASSCRPGV